MKNTPFFPILLLALLPACFGMGLGSLLGSGGKFHKVDIYPTAQTWSQLDATAKKLGWKTEPNSGGYELKAWTPAGEQLFMDAAPNVCAVSADQYGNGCSGLRFQCEDGVERGPCTKRLMTLLAAAGQDPAKLKVSNNMARTDDGTPYQP